MRIDQLGFFDVDERLARLSGPANLVSNIRRFIYLERISTA
ncbi:hypothetical protein [Agrobacterium pusense]|nr:hypothetical protein [Agrobacterium pusense]